MPAHDVECTACGKVTLNYSRSPWPDEPITCEACNTGQLTILWTAGTKHIPAVHSTERSVVWENPATGEIRYPGKNDIPIPQRYAAAGFVRKELSSLREVERFEKEHKVQNEAAWFDKGSGRDFCGDS